MQGNTEEKGWLSQEFLSEDEMRRMQAHALGVPFVLLAREDIEQEALMLIPEPLSRAHSVVAYRTDGGVVEVALLDIADLEKISFLHPDKKIRPRLTNQASIKQALLVYQKNLKEKFGRALQAGSVDALVLHALLNQASDIHLDVASGGTHIRYRVQGVLHDAMHITAEAGTALMRSIKSLAKLFSEPVVQGGKFALAKDGETIQVSVTNVPGVEGEKLTMRLAREHSGQQGFTLSALGLHGTGLEQTHKLLHVRSGLVLVCGPSGSGKTTALYTLLDHIHGSERAIVTIEEKIEHRLRYATQTQTRPELGLTMLGGLRAALRTDPDVVLVGSVDSAEVAQLALEAASRGVLVFAAIDARSASGAIEKLLSFDISPRLIAQNLRGVIAQRLAHRLVDNKGGEDKLSREEAAAFEYRANFARVLAVLKEEEQIESHLAWKDLLFYKGEEGGGMIGVQEVLPVSTSIKEMILQNADAEVLEAEARKEGMLTLAEDALFKAATGAINIDEAFEVAGE